MSHSDSFDGRGTHTSNRARLAALATQQFGVVSAQQLFALGFSYDDVRGYIRRGQLHRLHPGVLAVGHTRLVPHARLLAALLACGPQAFLSHRTAAAVWGLRALNLRAIEVTLPGTSTKARPGLALHRTGQTLDVTSHNGLRVSCVSRLLIELAPREKPAELDRLITQAVRKQVLDLVAMEQALTRHTRRPGLSKLKAALRDYRPQPDRKSDLERAFDNLIAGTDIPPPQRNVIVDGWELDCYWPGQRLAVELDGRPYHVAVRDMERDKRKDAKLLRIGIAVIRITGLRLELEPQAVLADVRALTT